MNQRRILNFLKITAQVVLVLTAYPKHPYLILLIYNESEFCEYLLFAHCQNSFLASEYTFLKNSGNSVAAVRPGYAIGMLPSEASTAHRSRQC